MAIAIHQREPGGPWLEVSPSLKTMAWGFEDLHEKRFDKMGFWVHLWLVNMHRVFAKKLAKTLV